MNTPLLARLLGLRYRLLWAQARLRNGKIVVFVVGYLLLCVVIAVLALGGLGAALASIRVGKAELVARIVLGVCFLNALLAAVVLGFGMNSVFSGATLRRYPLSAVDRFAARQISAFLEPLWMLVLSLDLGMAIGSSILGVASLWVAVPAAALLAMGNYLLARVVLTLVERIMATRTGPLYLMMVVVPLFMMPAFIAPALIHIKGMPVVSVLRFTPPFAAAAVMASAALLPTLGWVLYLVAWCLVLVVALVQLERLPIPSRTVAGALATWENPCDQVAALFGTNLSPLVGKILRYYVRSPALRLSYPTAAIFIVLMTLSLGGRTDPTESFLIALSAVSVVGSIGAVTANVFGFDGAGFRRYFLLPVAPAAVFRAAALVPLLIGAMLIPVSLLLWLFVTPTHIDARMAVMLISSGFSGMFLLQALGLWTSLLSPRAIELKFTFGNKQSFLANALMMGTLVVLFGSNLWLDHLGPKAVLDHWWVTPLILLATGCFYLLTLRAGATVFAGRRERMLFTIERGC
jgi:hypothetical protein